MRTSRLRAVIYDCCSGDECARRKDPACQDRAHCPGGRPRRNVNLRPLESQGMDAHSTMTFGRRGYFRQPKFDHLDSHKTKLESILRRNNKAYLSRKFLSDQFVG